MKIALTKTKTYVYFPTQQLYRSGEVYEVQEEMGKELLTRIDDYGVPFFRRADGEEATIVEQEIVTPNDVDRSIEATPRRRGRPPQLNKDANGESDSGAVTV